MIIMKNQNAENSQHLISSFLAAQNSTEDLHVSRGHVLGKPNLGKIAARGSWCYIWSVVMMLDLVANGKQQEVNVPVGTNQCNTIVTSNAMLMTKAALTHCDRVPEI